MLYFVRSGTKNWVCSSNITNFTPFYSVEIITIGLSETRVLWAGVADSRPRSPFSPRSLWTDG